MYAKLTRSVSDSRLVPISTPFTPPPSVAPSTVNTTVNYTFNNLSFVPDPIFLSFSNDPVPKAELGLFNGTGSVVFVVFSLIEYDSDLKGKATPNPTFFHVNSPR